MKNQDDINKIISLYKEDNSIREVARMLHITRGVVHAVLIKHNAVRKHTFSRTQSDALILFASKKKTKRWERKSYLTYNYN